MHHDTYAGDYSVFDDVSKDITSSCMHYRKAKSNSPMVEKLFAPHPKTHDLTLNILKTYGTALRERLTAKQGGAAEFLAGGKLFNPSGAVADLMSLVDATSDPIESFFGMHDNVATSLSKNTSFLVTGTLATWRHNHTTSFLQSLSKVQMQCIMKGAVRRSRHLKRESDAAISEAAAAKLKRLLKQAKANRETEKKLIHSLLNLRRKKLFKTIGEYEDFCELVNNADKKIIKELKVQIRLLHQVRHIIYARARIHTLTHALEQVHGHPRSKLMTFTVMGDPLSPHILRRQYRVVLSKVESGELSSRARSILATVMKDRRVFRGGTSIDDKDDKERRQYYTDMIAECKAERAEAASATG